MSKSPKFAPIGNQHCSSPADGINEWLANWKRRGWKTAAKKPVKNKDLWMALDEATERHDIQWKWVRGHTGNPGNEEADALANQGIDEL